AAALPAAARRRISDDRARAVFTDANRRVGRNAVFSDQLVRRIELDGHVHRSAVTEAEVPLGVGPVIAVTRLRLAAINADLVVPEQVRRPGGVNADLRSCGAVIAGEADGAHGDPVLLREVVAIKREEPGRVGLLPAQ